jgi:hypothetical protein
MFGYLFNEGNSLALLYGIFPGGIDKELDYSRFNGFPPIQASDLSTHKAVIPYLTVDVAGSVDGYPALMGRNGDLYLALTQMPSDVADWLLVDTPNNFKGYRLISHGGLPAYFTIAAGTGYIEYLNPVP